MFKILCRQRWIKIWSFFCGCLSNFPDFANIEQHRLDIGVKYSWVRVCCYLTWGPYWVSWSNACWAILIPARISETAPPSLLTTLPKTWSHLPHQHQPFTMQVLLSLVFIRNELVVFFMLIKPQFITSLMNTSIALTCHFTTVLWGKHPLSRVSWNMWSVFSVWRPRDVSVISSTTLKRNGDNT